jgi:FdhE protein
MRDSWQKRIDRASELAARDEAARPLLEVYGKLLVLQRDCSASLQAQRGRLSGSLERDLAIVGRCAPRILHEVTAIGPPLLADEARQIIGEGGQAIDRLLLLGWRAPSDEHFFARLLLQPYAYCLAANRLHPLDRDLPKGDNVCPFCGGAPQVSILRQMADLETGGRELMCATCFTTWPFRRVQCAECGEEDERKLGYFHSPAYDYLRVDACETCKHYLKSVDLARLGLAVPIVDEVAGAPLDLWARERGYEKIHLNLVGL